MKLNLLSRWLMPKLRLLYKQRTLWKRFVHNHSSIWWPCWITGLEAWLQTRLTNDIRGNGSSAWLSGSEDFIFYHDAFFFFLKACLIIYSAAELITWQHMMPGANSQQMGWPLVLRSDLKVIAKSRFCCGLSRCQCVEWCGLSAWDLQRNSTSAAGLPLCLHGQR